MHSLTGVPLGCTIVDVLDLGGTGSWLGPLGVIIGVGHVTVEVTDLVMLYSDPVSGCEV